MLLQLPTSQTPLFNLTYLISTADANRYWTIESDLSAHSAIPNVYILFFRAGNLSFDIKSHRLDLMGTNNDGFRHFFLHFRALSEWKFVLYASSFSPSGGATAARLFLYLTNASPGPNEYNNVFILIWMERRLMHAEIGNEKCVRDSYGRRLIYCKYSVDLRHGLLILRMRNALPPFRIHFVLHQFRSLYATRNMEILLMLFSLRYSETSLWSLAGCDFKRNWHYLGCFN